MKQTYLYLWYPLFKAQWEKAINEIILLCKKNHSDSTKKFSETDIINMFEFLNDNIITMFGGGVFQQTVGIPMGTICVPLQ
jgi:hypothetical protein